LQAKSRFIVGTLGMAIFNWLADRFRASHVFAVSQACYAQLSTVALCWPQ